MGQVWLTEQPAPVKRLVALKLIKGGLYDMAKDTDLKSMHGDASMPWLSTR